MNGVIIYECHCASTSFVPQWTGGRRRERERGEKKRGEGRKEERRREKEGEGRRRGRKRRRTVE